MNVKHFTQNSARHGRHAPHGLSRAPAHNVVLPVALGLVCVTAVLGVLWLAYTFG
ncbi:MAG TPA: hypothetical protein VMH92_08350 [Acidocella sp.]|nr:hypothetical protein [Acidocella sp.]